MTKRNLPILKLNGKWQIEISNSAIKEELFLLSDLAVGAAHLHESRVRLACRIIMIFGIIGRQVKCGAGCDLEYAPVDAGADCSRVGIPFGNLTFGKANLRRDVHFLIWIKI